jgi:hypothetical protein
MNVKPRDPQTGLHFSQAQAVELLASGMNITAAAERLSLNRRTLSKWINSDNFFQLALGEKEAELLAAGTRKMMINYVTSADLLAAALAGEKVSARQMQAANAVLRTLPALLECVGLHTRLNQLERRIHGYE